jgi:lipoprotein-releasing system permease protein
MIFDAVERMVAFRYLRARRQEGFVSVIAIFSLTGIALGVATLIVTLSIMNGFRAELLGRILGFSGHLSVYAAQGPLDDYDAIAGKIAALPGITSVRAVIDGQVMVAANGRSSGAAVRGIGARDLATQEAVASHLSPGALDRFTGDNVLIGSRLADKLRLKIGDHITLLSPNGQATAFGTVPRVKTYTVGGTFEVGEFEYDSGFVFMPLAAVQLFLGYADSVSSLEVSVADADRIRRFGNEIQAAMGTTVRLVDWQQRSGAFFGAVETERNVMFIILSLIILVAAFNIISSMIMMVKDKGHDIAIMRTMGATRAMVLRIFILSGASVGVVGTLVGLLLGVGVTLNLEAIRAALKAATGVDPFSAAVYHLSRIPERIQTMDVVLVVVIAFVLSFLATLYPSWRAARLDPVEALRYE